MRTAMERRATGCWGLGARAAATGVGLAAALLLATEPARAVLVPQMGRCAPYFADTAGDNGPLGQGLVSDQLGAGMYNTAPTLANAASRLLHVQYAWAPGPNEDAQTAIGETFRVELCWVDQMGAFVCPGWKGDVDYILLDTKTYGITPPPASVVKASEGAAAAVANIVSKDVPVDWDDPANEGKLLFFVVNAQTEPTSLLSVASGVLGGGYCQVPTRLAKRADTHAGCAVRRRHRDSERSAFPSPYAALNTTPTPPGSIFGQSCSVASNKTGYSRFDANPCIDLSAMSSASIDSPRSMTGNRSLFREGPSFRWRTATDLEKRRRDELDELHSR